MIFKSFITLIILAGSLTSFVNAAALSPTRRIAALKLARQNYDLPGVTSNSKKGSGNGGLGSAINTVLPNDNTVGQSTEDIDIELEVALKVPIRPDAIQLGAIQPGAIQSDAAQPGTIQSDAAQSDAAQPGAIQSGTTQPGAIATTPTPATSTTTSTITVTVTSLPTA